MKELTKWVSAALRHISDAEALVASSPDQASHLAGFGPECMRKAVITISWLGKALGHDVDGSELPILDLGLDLDAHARRHAGITRLTSMTPLNQWNPVHRYEATGTRKALAQPLVDACRREVDIRVTSLFADGLLTEEVP